MQNYEIELLTDSWNISIIVTWKTGKIKWKKEEHINYKKYFYIQ